MPKVYVSSVIEAPASRVWSMVRDFNGLPSWTPFVADSRIEQNLPSDKVGCIRNFTLRDGGRIREQLLALSDYEYACPYSSFEGPLGVQNYVPTPKLSPIPEGERPFAEWTAECDCPPDRVQALTRQIGQNVFQAA